MSTARVVVAAASEQPFGDLQQRWADLARSSGRHHDAEVLEGRDDLADVEQLERAAEREMLADFRRDVEREFALALLHAESQGDDIYRGPTR